MQQRSIFITVLAWVFIIFSGLGLLEFAMMIFVPFSTMMKLPTTNGNEQVLESVTSMMHIMFIVMAVLSCWTLIASVGLLLRKNWARIAWIVMMIIGLIFSAIYLVVGTITTIYWPDMQQLQAGVTAQAQIMTQGFMIAMVVLSAVFALLYGWILYKLLTKSVAGEFKQVV